MANIQVLSSLDAPELDVYARLTQAQLRNRLEPEKGVFIAESPKVIQTALDAGLSPVSFLMEQRHISPAFRTFRSIRQIGISSPVSPAIRSRGVFCARCAAPLCGHLQTF